MIHHLVPTEQWNDRSVDEAWAPASLADEGFVHCSPDLASVIVVADRFYADARSLLVLDIDDARLGGTVVWEAAAHPDGSPTLPGEPEFPHVYGAIPADAITSVRTLERSPSGWRLAR